MYSLDYDDLVFSCKELLKGTVYDAASSLREAIEASLDDSLLVSVAFLEAAEELAIPLEALDELFNTALTSTNPIYQGIYINKVVSMFFEMNQLPYDFSTDVIIHPQHGTLQ